MFKKQITEERISVDVLFQQEGPLWVAVGLQLFLSAQGNTREEAEEKFREVFFATCQHDEQIGHPPIVNVEGAPEEYWKLAAQAEQI